MVKVELSIFAAGAATSHNQSWSCTWKRSRKAERLSFPNSSRSIVYAPITPLSLHSHDTDSDEVPA
eukprot:2417519-Rhodomonas_salina.4